ncbi:hypothetical protein [Chryseobacterium luquanense]|uniref:Uncharacterized protein n=1 Tax=Chryseobacterium luquanense TaxID=2983766 RepID=A0ABT3Y6V1_9FLAO|nr:hypothetical protein [Chryseobacterium luquanense]MCX8533885.1 hypothetical protein [Chryseobacterium luquanense]
MKKTTFSKLAGLVILFSMVFQSCRQENLMIDQQQESKNNYSISVLDGEQLKNKKFLAKEVGNIQKNFFKEINLNGKLTSPQDPLLDGAIIETQKVLEITNGTEKTYTFPISRTYPNSVIENLVLKENSDNTYSGVLMQYSLTKEEKEQYISGQTINLEGKIKTFSINNISLASKGGTYSYYDGCWEYIYETHPCAGTEHHGVGASCPLAGTPSQAQPNTIIAAINHCGEESGGGGSGGGSTGPGGGGSSPGSGTIGGGSGGGGGSTQPTSPYNTFMFISYDDMYLLCSEGDTQCAVNWANMSGTVSFLNSLGRNGMNLSGYTDIFMVVKNYLIANNFSSTSQVFLSDRLNVVGNWFRAQDNTTEEKKLNNYKIATWALNLLMEEDTEDVSNFFNRIDALRIALIQNKNLLIDIPCSELDDWQLVAQHNVPQSVKDKLQNIKNQTSWWSNWQITDLDDGASTRINMDVFPIKINSLPNNPNSNQKFTPEEFFNFFRLNLNQFAEKFTPIVDSYYGINDTNLWNSSNPLGSLIHIEIPFDNGTVVCSGFGSKAWVFSTIKAPMSNGYDGVHPVAGNRLFGYYIDPNDSTMYLYTRGVDRVSQVATSSPNLANYLIVASAFYGADQLWTGMQSKVSKYINDNGGSANSLPAKTYRPNYTKVRNYLKGKAAITSLGCN